MTQEIVHLHVRSDMSFPSPAPIGDYVGAARIVEYVGAVKAMGHTALAFTELGSMRGMYEQIVQSQKAGIRPIFGVEVYVCPDVKKKNVSPEQRELIHRDVERPSEWREAVDEYADENGYMRRDKDLTTLVLWAGSEQGLRNLFRLMYESWHPDHFYHKPRVDLRMLAEYSDGVFCGTGGPNSFVNRPLVESKRRDALNNLARLHAIYGERLRLEVRPQHILPQFESNTFAVEQSAKLGVPLLATGAVHYLAPGDHKFQKMLAAIGSRDSYDFAGLDLDSYWLRSGDEMLADLQECGLTAEQAKAACDETISLAAQLDVKFELDSFKMILPEIDTKGMSHNDYLRKLCEESPVWATLESQGRDLAVYRERMEYELQALGRKVSERSGENTFASYSLYVREVMEIGRELGIIFGPGRGSAAGSLVSWLIGITQIDPVRFNLSFERYLNPNRVGPPDIDVDLDPSRRADLFEAMRKRYGFANVAQLSAMGKLKGRAIVGDVCRVISMATNDPDKKISIKSSKQVTAGIELRSDAHKRPYTSVSDSFLGYTDDHGNKFPPVPACVAFHKQHPEVLEYASKLEGKMKVLNIHAGGIVAAPLPLYNYVPMETRKEADGEGRVYVVAFEKIGVEETGLLKIDMLGIETINTIALALEAINSKRQAQHVDALAELYDMPEDFDGARRWELEALIRELEIPITMESIPYDDQATLDAFTAGDFTGVFQYDTHTMSKLAKGMKFDRFEVTADMTALGRPGPLDSGMAYKYVQRAMGETPVEIDYAHEVSELLAGTFGIMIYQEQIMQIAGELAGHQNPDELRKIIGKKLVNKMEAERPGFVSGMVQNIGMQRETADKMFDDIATFGEYSFNKSHSIAYARIGWICQYCKVHYPLEWSWASISTAKPEKRRHFAKDAARRGVQLLPPDVSISGYTLTMDRERNAILGALSDIKGVGEKAAASIVMAQPFDSFDDFMRRVDRKAVHAGVIVKLARAGALDRLLPNPRWFVEHREDLFAESKRKAWTTWAEALAGSENEQQWDQAERALEAGSVNPMALENPYSKLLSQLAIDAREDFAGDEFFEQNDGAAMWVSGTIVEPRTFQNTPFEREATEAERKHRSYAADYVSAQLEDSHGARVKIKVPWNVYEHCRAATEDGSPVVALVVPDAEYSTLRAKLVIDLEGMRNGSLRNIWTELVLGNHPANLIEWPTDRDSDYDRKISTRDYNDLVRRFHDYGANKDEDPSYGAFKMLPVVGMVTDVNTKLAGKNKTEMAWLGVLTQSGEYIKITVFSSDWLGGWDRRARVEKPPMIDNVKPGTFARFNTRSEEYNGEKSCVLSGAWRVYGQGKME